MAGASGNILLSLSTSLGPGGFASLQSLIQMVGAAVRVVKEMASEAIDLSRALDQVTLDVTGADKATKGLVNTLDLYLNAAKLEAAQLGATAKEYENLNKFGAAFAQKTGRDVTEVVNSLTTALVSGRTQGLKQFSLEITQGTTLAETYATAMKEIEAKSKTMTVEIRDTSDAIDALNNNIGSTPGLFLNAMEGSDGLFDSIMQLNGVFADLNKELLDANDTMEETGANWTEFLEDLVFKINPVALAIRELAEAMGILEDADLARERKYQSKRRENQIADLETQVTDEYFSQMEQEYGFESPDQSVYYAPEAAAYTPKKKKPKGGGGGGGGKAFQADMEFDLYEASTTEAGIYDLTSAGVDDAAATNDILSERLDIYDAELDSLESQESAMQMILADEDERLQILRERMAEDPASMSLEEKGEVWQADYEQQQQQYQLELELHAWKLENDEAYEKKHNERMRALWMKKADFGMASAASLFGSLSKLQDKENKAAFKRAQAYAIVEAVINTAAAAVKAMNAGLSIGGPAGIALGIAAMAAAVVAGAAQIATIKKQKYEGGGGGGGDVKAGSFSASASSAGSEAGGGGDSSQTEVIVTVNVEGSLAGVADGITAASEYAVKTGRWSQGNN